MFSNFKNLIPLTGTSNKQNREQWLEKKLSNILNGQKILDAGAGELQYKKYCSHLEYVSQDFGQYNGTGNNIGLQKQKRDNTKLDILSDVISIPVENESFDAIMCVEVLEHLPEPAKAIKEFFRILKPGGKLLITAPFCSLTHYAPYHYGTGYNRYWYEKILNKYNFTITELEYNGNYFEYLAQEIRRLPTVEKKYTNLKKSNNLINKISKLLFLRLLQSLSSADKGSDELLSYGIHVLATKK